MGIGGKQSPYIYFENNRKKVHCSEQWETTMERMFIVLDNRLKEQCSASIWGTMAINSRQ
jgi:hypothetical protein